VPWGGLWLGFGRTRQFKNKPNKLRRNSRTHCQMNSSRSVSLVCSALCLYFLSYMARYMQVSKKALVGSFVPVATNSKNSSMSPFRSRQRKEGSLSTELVRNSSSSLIRKDLSSSAIAGV